MVPTDSYSVESLDSSSKLEASPEACLSHLSLKHVMLPHRIAYKTSIKFDQHHGHAITILQLL